MATSRTKLCMVCSFVRYIRYSTDFFFSPPRCRHHRCLPPPSSISSSFKTRSGSKAEAEASQAERRRTRSSSSNLHNFSGPVKTSALNLYPTYLLLLTYLIRISIPYLTIPYILLIILPVLTLRYVVASTPDSSIAFIISSCHSKCCPPPPVYARASPLCQQLQNHTFFFPCW